MNFLKVMTVSAVSIWLGALAFFSFFVAPAAFTVLERESAGRLVTTVFPRYYAFGAVLGLLALAAVAARLAAGGRSPAVWGSLLLALLMLALTVVALLLLLPAAESARAAMRAAGALPGSAAPEAQAFSRIHRLSVLLNGLTLLAGLALICLEAVRTRG